MICSGTSEPQTKAIANEIETHLREHNSLRPVAVDGFPASQWMVLDYLQVVVHIFHRDKRAFYSLEGLSEMRCSTNSSQKSNSFPAVTSETDGCASRGSLSVASALFLGWRRLAEEELSENPAEHPVEQVLAAGSHPAIRRQKSGSNSHRCPRPSARSHTRGSRE